MPLLPSDPSGFSNARTLFSVCVLLLCGPLVASQQTPSSAEVLRLPDDTAKVLLLSDQCFALRRTHPDSAGFMGLRALALARELGFKRGEAQALNDLAILHLDRSDYVGADSLLHASLALREALGDQGGMAAVYNKLGIGYQARFMFEHALDVDQKALAIYERIGPPEYEATLLNNIGILQFNLRRYPEALATHQRAAALRDSIGDGFGLAGSQGNLGNVLLAMADTLEAIRLYEAAIAAFKQLERPMAEAVQLHNLAGVRLAQGDLARAEAGYTRALALRTDADERKGMASSLIGLGSIRMEQGRYAEAGTLLHRGLALASEVGARSERLEALDRLARLHTARNNPDSTLWYHDRFNSLKDSVFNADLGRRLAEAEARYDAEKRERHIQEQRAAIAELQTQGNRRKLALFTTIAGAVLVVLLGLVLFQIQRRRSRARQDALLIRERDAGLRGILQATESERKRMARELHDGVGQQLAALKMRLETLRARTASADPSPMEQVIGLADKASREIRGIAHDLMPSALEQMGLEAAVEDLLEQSLSGTAIDHRFHSSLGGKRLPPAVEVNLYRIVQELVQNTLKHADASEIGVDLRQEKSELILRYTDNGKGIPATGMGAGIGLANMRERARALGGTLELSRPGGHGLRADIRIDLAGTDRIGNLRPEVEP